MGDETGADLGTIRCEAVDKSWKTVDKSTLLWTNRSLVRKTEKKKQKTTPPYMGKVITHPQHTAFDINPFFIFKVVPFLSTRAI